VRTLFQIPYAASNAEPSQSAQRPHKILRPSNPPDMVCREGRRCVFFFCDISQERFARFCTKRAVRLRASNGDAGRAFIFLKEAPVLDLRPEFALPSRIRVKPAGGQSPAGAEFSCVRSVRATHRSASPESGVRVSPSAPFLELWCSTVAQRTFNPPGAGATPAGSTKP
jgi:hypothetical protein